MPREPFAEGGEGAAKKSDTVRREPKIVRFAFIARYCGLFSCERVYLLFGVSDLGLKAW